MLPPYPRSSGPLSVPPRRVSFQHDLSDAYRGNRRRRLRVCKMGLRFQEPLGAATLRRL